jgi:hypothetical protein
LWIEYGLYDNEDFNVTLGESGGNGDSQAAVGSHAGLYGKGNHQALRQPEYRFREMLSMAGLRGGGCQELRGTERYDYIRFLREAAEIVALNPLRGAPIRDVSDMVVMQTVVIGEADFLCTRDQDFYTPEVLTYLEGMGTKVLDDVALIHRLRP